MALDTPTPNRLFTALKARITGYTRVTADAYARGVEIRNGDETLRLSDNYFDLNAGSKTVRILQGDTKGLRCRSVYEIGREELPAATEGGNGPRPW